MPDESKLEDIQELLQSANYLNVPAVFELACARIGAIFKGRNLEEVKKLFGLEGVKFTPEDEAQMLKEYPWILESLEREKARVEGL